MISLALLWCRRLWPYVTLAVLFVAAFWLLRACGDAGPAMERAHEATAVAAQAAERADAIVRVDTVERRVVVTRYQTLRDSAGTRLTDTLIVARALNAADSAIGRSDSSLAKMARASVAKDILVGALRTELGISERLRAPRYRVSSYVGVEVDGTIPVTGLEAEVRVTQHWSVVARVEQRWAPGESTRRLLLVRYTLPSL